MPEERSAAGKQVEQVIPATPAGGPVKTRPSTETVQKERDKQAEKDDPNTVYEINVTQWGHDENRFVRGQLVARADIPEGYDFKSARENGTLIPSTVSLAELRK